MFSFMFWTAHNDVVMLLFAIYLISLISIFCITTEVFMLMVLVILLVLLRRLTICDFSFNFFICMFSFMFWTTHNDVVMLLFAIYLISLISIFCITTEVFMLMFALLVGSCWWCS